MAMDQAAALFGFLSALMAAQPLDRQAVERVAELRLSPSDGDWTGTHYEGVVRRPDGLAARVRLIEPQAGAASDWGRRLSVLPVEACVARTAALAWLFPQGMEAARTATADGSSNFEVSWVIREEAWGEVSLAFDKASPDCLQSVLFEMKPAT